MSFSSIKEYVNSISEENYKEIIPLLSADGRKNVKKLSEKLSNYLDGKSKELLRVKKLYDFDRNFNVNGCLAGVDEVGRGPLAGPIVAAAVILNLDVLDENLILEINDSKKITAKKREELSKIIMEKAICYNIELMEHNKIDIDGIGICNQAVLKNAAINLKIKPDFVVSDGYAIKNIGINNAFAIKGDSKSASIACASIIAKVYRDNLMKKYAEEYPNYHFENNSGYGSKEHIEAIKKFGTCPIHRMSFLRNIL
ncbi:ribonuclease HII [Clostridium akagii]|uniref:ribonuclease HII n=1 Tax=Clostridium akagii TaxID=91623 RepID=UPI00055BF73F|nr:ribonuclease HII [Clostridium akagii]